MRIIQSYQSVLEAVEANIEKFQFNPAEARRSAKCSDSGFGRDPGATDVWLLDDGNVWFVYQTNDGLRLLHKLTFHSCLDNADFKIVEVNHVTDEVTGTTHRLSKSSRRLAAEFCQQASGLEKSYVLGSVHDQF